MKNFSIRCLLALSFFCAVGLMMPTVASVSEPIPVVGLGKEGQSQVELVSDSAYFQMLQTSMTSVQESMSPTLTKISKTENSQWVLKSIGVSLGITASLKLEPVGSVSVSPKVGLSFSDVNSVPSDN